MRSGDGATRWTVSGSLVSSYYAEMGLFRMRLAWLTLLALAPVPADATPTLSGDPRGLIRAFVDKVPMGFLDRFSTAKNVLVQRDLTELLFPGGEACDNSDSATAGPKSAFAVSPDGATMLIVTTVTLDAKRARAFGVAAAPGKVSTLVATLHGPSAKLWAAILDEGGDCERAESRVTYSPDGKRASIISRLRAASDASAVALVDVAARTVRADVQGRQYAISPGMNHVAAMYGLFHVDAQTISEANAPTALRWVSESSLTYCDGGTPYRVDVERSDSLKVTKLDGACR